MRELLSKGIPEIVLTVKYTQSNCIISYKTKYLDVNVYVPAQILFMFT